MTTDDHAVNRDEVRLLTKLAHLPLPEDRQEQLKRTLSAYRSNFARLREISTGDAEPPSITYESEVQQ